MNAREIDFEKWHGLGNDFVVVRDEDVGPDFGPVHARALCDRRFGIGGDGVLVVTRGAFGASSARGAFGACSARMVVWNSDGSRPEMCGNGLRCVAAFLTDVGSSEELVVLTDAGARRCAVARDDTRAEVTIEMGRARFDEPLVVAVDGTNHSFSSVNMGNPHAVTFEPYAPSVRDVVAPVVSRAPAEGTNVEFVTTGPRGLEVFVWERGVGPTLACGTGACAVAAEAVRTGRASRDEAVSVALPGGVLAITVGSDDAVSMRGPAELVARGVFPRSLLASVAPRT